MKKILRVHFPPVFLLQYECSQDMQKGRTGCIFSILGHCIATSGNDGTPPAPTEP